MYRDLFGTLVPLHSSFSPAQLALPLALVARKDGCSDNADAEWGWDPLSVLLHQQEDGEEAFPPGFLCG